MDATTQWSELADSLVGALHLATSPVAITFSHDRPEGVAGFGAPLSEPAADGRRGRVSAGCVFWVHGATSTFSTAPEDHGNCSIGSVTHGLARLEDVTGRDDVGALLESGWVSPDAVGGIPAVAARPGAITYGPLRDTPAHVEPDVVLLRVNGRQLMVLADALPQMRIGGKPQCHVVALAKEEQVPAASVGCALSRARTGMTPDEMTCALPARGLRATVEAVTRAAGTDTAVARYAAADARRFA